MPAESKESISFTAGMSCSAQIDEKDAAKFLYRYNAKPLAQVMDSEVRPFVETCFVEECSKRDLADILTSKEAIMKAVRDKTLSYFKDRGVTITVIGLKGDAAYDQKDIQDSINKKFIAAKELEAQKVDNDKKIAAAQAEQDRHLFFSPQQEE